MEFLNSDEFENRQAETIFIANIDASYFDCLDGEHLKVTGNPAIGS